MHKIIGRRANKHTRIETIVYTIISKLQKIFQIDVRSLRTKKNGKH
jgi:hypothetical protein